jgi:hypothetical protein
MPLMDLQFHLKANRSALERRIEERSEAGLVRIEKIKNTKRREILPLTLPVLRSPISSCRQADLGLHLKFYIPNQHIFVANVSFVGGPSSRRASSRSWDIERMS